MKVCLTTNMKPGIELVIQETDELQTSKPGKLQNNIYLIEEGSVFMCFDEAEDLAEQLLDAARAARRRAELEEY